MTGNEIIEAVRAGRHVTWAERKVVRYIRNGHERFDIVDFTAACIPLFRDDGHTVLTFPADEFKVEDGWVAY